MHQKMPAVMLALLLTSLALSAPILSPPSVLDALDDRQEGSVQTALAAEADFPYDQLGANQLANGDFEAEPVEPCPDTAQLPNINDDHLEDAGICGSGLFLDWGATWTADGGVDGSAGIQMFDENGVVPMQADASRPGLVRAYVSEESELTLSEVSLLQFSYLFDATDPSAVPLSDVEVLLYLKLDAGDCLVASAFTLGHTAGDWQTLSFLDGSGLYTYNIEDGTGQDCVGGNADADGTACTDFCSMPLAGWKDAMGDRSVTGIGLYLQDGAGGTPQGSIFVDNLILAKQSDAASGDGYFAEFSGLTLPILALPAGDEYSITVTAHQKNGADWDTVADDTLVKLTLQLDCGGLYTLIGSTDLCQSGFDGMTYNNPLEGLRLEGRTTDGAAGFTFTAQDLKDKGAWPSIEDEFLPLTALHAMADFGGKTSHHNALANALFAQDEDLADLLEDTLPFTPVVALDSATPVETPCLLDSDVGPGLLLGDADGDGYSNLVEWLEGSDVCDPASTPADHDADGYTDNEECPPSGDPADCTDAYTNSLHPSEVFLLDADDASRVSHRDFADAGAPGAPVAYEFTVVNDGRAEDRIHVSASFNEADSDWSAGTVVLSTDGTLATSDALPPSLEEEEDDGSLTIVLAAGASATVTATVTVANVANGGVIDAVGVHDVVLEPLADDERPAYDDAVCSDPGRVCQSPPSTVRLETTAALVESLVVVVDDDPETVVPGGSVDYGFTVKNLGNQDGIFDLTESRALVDGAGTPLAGVGNYGVQILSDTGVPTSSVSLSAGTSWSGTVHVMVPAWDADAQLEGAFWNDKMTVTVTATSAASAALTSNDAVATTTDRVRAVVVSGESAKDITPTTPVEYALSVRNTGNSEDTFTLSVVGTATGWTATILDDTCATGTGSSGALAPGASLPFCLRVTATTGKDDGASQTFTVKAESAAGDDKATGTHLTTTTVNQEFGVSLTAAIAPADAQTRDPAHLHPGASDATDDRVFEGEVLVFSLSATNDGTGTDALTLSFDKPTTSWAVAFFAADCSTALGSNKLASVGAGETVDACAKVTVGTDNAGTFGYDYETGVFSGQTVEVAAMFTATTSAKNAGAPAPESDTASVSLYLWDRDLDGDGSPDFYDGDVDNDGYTNVEEQGSNSDPFDEFSTVIDDDGDGILNAVENIIEFEIQRDQGLSEQYRDNRIEGTPNMAVPDLSTLERITIYNVRYISPQIPVARAPGAPLATVDFEGGVPTQVCIWTVRSPLSAVPLSQDLDTCVPPGNGGGGVWPIEQEILDFGVVGIDEAGEPYFVLGVGEGDLRIEVSLQGGTLTLTHPSVQELDRDGDGYTAVYLVSCVTVISGGMPEVCNTSEGGSVLVPLPDTDDTDPAVGGSLLPVGDGFVAHFEFPGLLVPNLGPAVLTAETMVSVTTRGWIRSDTGYGPPANEEYRLRAIDSQTGQVIYESNPQISNAGSEVQWSIDRDLLLNGSPSGTILFTLIHEPTGRESSYDLVSNVILEVAGALQDSNPGDGDVPAALADAIGDLAKPRTLVVVGVPTGGE